MNLMQLFRQSILQDKTSLFSFLFVGLLSAAVNLGSFGILFNFFHLNYQIAISIAFVLAVIVHFTANRQLTFKTHTTQFFPQLQRYSVMLVTNYFITLLVVHFVVEALHFSPYAGIICAIGITVGLNYFISRFWIFQPSSQ